METYSVFGLSVMQTEILYELERKIIVNDICLSEKKIEIKNDWLSEWNKSIRTYLRDTLHINNIQIFNSFTTDNVLKECISHADSNNNVWKYMVLLECVLFSGYYPFKKEDTKKYKGLSMSKQAKRDVLEKIAKDYLEVDPKYIDLFRKAFENSIKRMSNYWLKVLGVSLGVIALVLIAILTYQYEILGLFAAEGTSGAAAITSGLAALGGGAIAAGGGGVAAGTAVFVGGGILLGTAVGIPSGLFVATATNSKLVLSQAAKMEVVLKEIVLAIQKDTAYFQKVLLNLQEQTSALTAELQKMKMDEQNNKKKISELQKSIKYLESVIIAVQK